MFANMVALVWWAGELNLPHASGMIAAASKDGLAVIKDIESVGFKENVVACVT